MNVLVIDTGFGGYAVAAEILAKLEKQEDSFGVQIIYVSATPSDRCGYNQMGGEEEQVERFNRFLTSVTKKFSPERIVIACNTLCSLFDKTCYAEKTPLPIDRITEIGPREFVKQKPPGGVLLLATETTILQKVLEGKIRELKVDSFPLVPKACPGLATAISNNKDLETLIRSFLEDGMASFSKGEKFSIYLGCSHYGYREDLFSSVLRELGVKDLFVFNPNKSLTQLVLKELRSTEAGEISIQFHARYPLPSSELKQVFSYIHPISPQASQALLSYQQTPSLF